MCVFVFVPVCEDFVEEGTCELLFLDSIVFLRFLHARVAMDLLEL